MQELLTRFRENAVQRTAVVRRGLWSAVLNGTRKARDAAKNGHDAVEKALFRIEERANHAIETESALKPPDLRPVSEPTVRAA